MDTSKYKALYLQETGEHLKGVEKGLLTLEKDPVDAASVDALFRHYHSIKGMSASMGYDPLAKLAHAQEDLLDKIRQKKIPFSADIAGALLKCLDALRNLVARVEEDIPLDVDISPFVEALKAAAEGSPSSAPKPVAAVEETAPEGLKLSHVMKVEGSVFDDLLATVGDLFMVLSAFRALSHESRSVAVKDGIYSLGKTVNTLHGSILSARMLPIADLTEGLPRVIRDLCKACGKDVELKLEGADLRLDRAILESLGSPLVHIIRNAVDHGIEEPVERARSGKGAKGSITVRAYSKKDRAVIEVSDDGRGINTEKLKEKARAKGVPEARLKTMTEKEVLMLICVPGLSSSDKVTDISGRGVGMDVVKEAIEGLGGALEIESVPGQGTNIILELPLTTSITKTLIVTVGSEQFLLPISRIVKVLEVRSTETLKGVYQIEGADVPLIHLAAALCMKHAERPFSTIIVVEHRGESGVGAINLVGVIVDDFGDEIDAYIKPLLPPISKLGGVSGITIMGDGRPVFLLDLPHIISKCLRQGI
ncbi:MAG: chemotaxis protein CheW [Deltaproteobacteria bacterium]|nr:chemotaxis protein CheW [Deltaproteobacteria bacterium]